MIYTQISTYRMSSPISFLVQINEIIEFNYDITDIVKFSEDFSKSLNISSEEICTYFKIIESTDDFPVNVELLKKYYNKPVTVKNFQKTFNIQDYEFKENEGNVDCVSYYFFKRFLSMVDNMKYLSMQKIENIISIDTVKKNAKLSMMNATAKPKNIFMGIILKSKEDNVTKLEFVKIKKTKLSELPVLCKDKEIIFQFAFDKDIDTVKVFNDSTKQLFLEKVDIIDRKKEREIDSQNIKIKESLDSMDKEERKLKEKDMLLKHVKVTMKSLGIQVKSTFITFPEEDYFNIEEMLDNIKSNISNCVSVEIITSHKSVEEKKESNEQSTEEKKDEDKQESQTEVEEESDNDSDDDAFGL